MLSATAAPVMAPKRCAEFRFHAPKLSGPPASKLFAAAVKLGGDLRQAFRTQLVESLARQGRLYSATYFHSDNRLAAEGKELHFEIDLKLSLIESRTGAFPSLNEQVEMLTDAITEALLKPTRGYDVSGSLAPFFCGHELSLEGHGNHSFTINEYRIALVISEHVD